MFSQKRTRTTTTSKQQRRAVTEVRDTVDLDAAGYSESSNAEHPLAEDASTSDSDEEEVTAEDIIHPEVSYETAGHTPVGGVALGSFSPTIPGGRSIRITCSSAGAIYFAGADPATGLICIQNSSSEVSVAPYQLFHVVLCSLG